MIDPLFASVEIEQDKEFTPVGTPLTLPLPVTVIAPPLLKIVPIVGAEMVRGAGIQAAHAAPGAPSAASTMSEAEASSAGRERPRLAGVNGSTR
jgi:hypothetical protein